LELSYVSLVPGHCAGGARAWRVRRNLGIGRKRCGDKSAEQKKRPTVAVAEDCIAARNAGGEVPRARGGASRDGRLRGVDRLGEELLETAEEYDALAEIADRDQ
jgi:hypothetical protein